MSRFYTHAQSTNLCARPPFSARPCANQLSPVTARGTLRWLSLYTSIHRSIYLFPLLCILAAYFSSIADPLTRPCPTELAAKALVPGCCTLPMGPSATASTATAEPHPPSYRDRSLQCPQTSPNSTAASTSTADSSVTSGRDTLSTVACSRPDSCFGAPFQCQWTAPHQDGARAQRSDEPDAPSSFEPPVRARTCGQHASAAIWSCSHELDQPAAGTIAGRFVAPGTAASS